MDRSRSSSTEATGSILWSSLLDFALQKINSSSGEKNFSEVIFHRNSVFKVAEQVSYWPMVFLVMAFWDVLLLKDVLCQAFPFTLKKKNLFLVLSKAWLVCPLLTFSLDLHSNFHSIRDGRFFFFWGQILSLIFVQTLIFASVWN